MWKIKDYLRGKNPCQIGNSYAINNFEDMASLWNACCRLEWLLWIVREVYRDKMYFPKSPIDWGMLLKEFSADLDEVEKELIPAARRHMAAARAEAAGSNSKRAYEVLTCLSACPLRHYLVAKLKELIPNPFEANLSVGELPQFRIYDHITNEWFSPTTPS